MDSDLVVYNGNWCDDFVSSNIAGFGYDINTEQLYVDFINGSSYIYYDVPPDVVEEWVDSYSKGVFHYYGIRIVYPYQRLN